MDVSDHHLVIVGAGSLGLFIASQALKSYSKVEIHEAKSQVGGNTRDFYSNSGVQFLSGCQYLSENTLPDSFDLANSLSAFEHRYSSLTEQGKNWNFKPNFSGPAFEFDFTKPQPLLFAEDSIADRLNLYPSNIRLTLKKFIQRIVPFSLDELHPTGLESLSLDRITSLDAEDDLLILKHSDHLADSIYGVSRELLGIGYEKAYIPNNGFDEFYTSLLESLRSFEALKIYQNQRISTKNWSSVAYPERSYTKIWCADPRFFVQHFKQKKLQSLSYPVYNYGLVVTGYSGFSLPYYINVFSGINPILRIYFYETKSQVKVTVESASLFDSELSLLSCLHRLLRNTPFKAKFSSKPVAMQKTRRYFPISNSDYNDIIDVENTMSDCGWTNTFPHLFSRAVRLNLIFDELGL